MAGAGSLETNNFKIPSVFGSGATYKTAPDMIPTTTPAGSIKASWKDGFPTQTFEPNNAPSGADFNGLFGLLSGLLMNTQMGQMINTYDAAYQGKIGGYPNGAIIWFVPNSESPNPDWSNRMLFQSTADGNTNVPYNTTTSTVGTGWKQLLPIVQQSYIPNYNSPLVPFNTFQSVNSNGFVYTASQLCWFIFNLRGWDWGSCELYMKPVGQSTYSLFLGDQNYESNGAISGSLILRSGDSIQAKCYSYVGALRYTVIPMQ